MNKVVIPLACVFLTIHPIQIADEAGTILYKQQTATDEKQEALLHKHQVKHLAQCIQGTELIKNAAALATIIGTVTQITTDLLSSENTEEKTNSQRNQYDKRNKKSNTGSTIALLGVGAYCIAQDFQNFYKTELKKQVKNKENGRPHTSH